MSFFELIKSLPAIFSALLELKKLWDHYISEQDRRAKMQKLADAIKVARETQDTSHIEQFFRDIINK